MKVNYTGKDVAEEYTSSLADLTINSKPLINMLTMLAEDYIDHAPLIVKVVELHLQKVTSDIKLPVLYLIDSIVKNVGKDYIQLFTQNIVSTFCSVFEKVDEKVRSQMFKLRQTWNDVFPPKKLFALDVRVHAIDPAWPITASPQSVRIHVNPRFLQAHSSSSSSGGASSSSAETNHSINDGVMREELLKQHKELLELQKRKVELELMQTKAILEEQQKKLENQAASFIGENPVGTTQLQSGTAQQNVQPSFSNAGPSNQHLATSNIRPKQYKSGGAGHSFRTRDPRIKFDKDKGSDTRNKGNSLKETVQSGKNEITNKHQRKEKRNFRKTKDRINFGRQLQNNNKNRLDSETDANKSSSCGNDPITELPDFEESPINTGELELDEKQENRKTEGGKENAARSISGIHNYEGCNNPTSKILFRDDNKCELEKKEGIVENEDKKEEIKSVRGKTIKRKHCRTLSPSSSAEDKKIEEEMSPSAAKKKLMSTEEIQTNSPNDQSRDIDLRLFSSKKSPNSPQETAGSNVNIDILFGDEDVDLRTFPHIVQNPPEINISPTKQKSPSSTESVSISKPSNTIIAEIEIPSACGDDDQSLLSSFISPTVNSPPTSSKRNTSSSANSVLPNTSSVTTGGSSAISASNNSNGGNQISSSGVASDDTNDNGTSSNTYTNPPNTSSSPLHTIHNSSNSGTSPANVTHNPSNNSSSPTKTCSSPIKVHKLSALSQLSASLKNFGLPTSSSVTSYCSSSTSSSVKSFTSSSSGKSHNSPSSVLGFSCSSGSSEKNFHPSPPLEVVKGNNSSESTSSTSSGSVVISSTAGIDEKSCSTGKKQNNTNGKVRRSSVSPALISHSESSKNYTEPLSISQPTVTSTSQSQQQNPSNSPHSVPVCPVTPSPPPPPIISKEDVAVENSWANYKRSKSEEGGIYITPEKKNISGRTRSPRSLFFSGLEDEIKENEKESGERSSENCNLIIKEAEHQLSNGNITFSQYNRMLKEVITINEERILKEALLKDENSEVDENEAEFSPAEDEYPKSGSPVDENDIGENYRNGSDSPPEFLSDGPVRENCENEPHPGVYGGHSDRKRSYYSDGNNRIAGSGPYQDCYPPNKIKWDPRMNKQKVIEQRRPPPWYGRPPVTQGMPINQGPPPPIQPPPLMIPRGNPSFYPQWASAPKFGPTHHYYESNNPNNFRYGPHKPVKKIFKQPIRPLLSRRQDVPPADHIVLDMIKNDTMRPIKINGIVREVRFYGETAIIMATWDDPREVTFQPGSRILTIDDRDRFVLHFNSPYRDCIVDGHLFKIRLGAPTRELFIDGIYYEMMFGGPPIQVILGGRTRKIQLSGPAPKVRLGNSRTDLVVGKINLIVDAKNIFPIYLDAKPQRFEVCGIPYILRFVEALRTVVINGVPFKFEFGGAPVPIYFDGDKHYLRLSVLPRGVRPGFLTISNMEGGRLDTPPPLEMNDSSVGHPVMNQYRTDLTPHYDMMRNDQPLDLITSLMPTTMAPLAGHCYDLEPVNTTAAVPQPLNTAQTTAIPGLGNINVGELFQKLVESGIVPPGGYKETSPAEEEDENTIKPVDFAKTETLKVKQPGLVKRLYSGIQCSSCGLRFSPEQTVNYSQHLDWHFRQNRRGKDITRMAQSRRWNYDISDWIQYQEIEDADNRVASWFEMQEKKKKERNDDDNKDEPSVVAEEGLVDSSCRVCHDKFDQFYNEEKEEWQLRKAVRVEGEVYHPLCYQELLENRAHIESPEIPLVTDDDPILIGETISLDDCQTVSDETEEILDKDKEIKSDTFDDFLLPCKENEVEIVAVTSEESNTKLDCEDDSMDITKKEEIPPEDDESDDDILHIEVVERKIESYEILDDDEEEEEEEEATTEENDMKSTNAQNETDTEEKLNNKERDVPEEDEVLDFSQIVVKTEKIDIADNFVPSHNVTVVSSIDGNVELDEATPVVLPKTKIKINISSKHIQAAKAPVVQNHDEHASEPPPPGEELHPASLKTAIVGKKLFVSEPINKGSDISGLCCVM